MIEEHLSLVRFVAEKIHRRLPPGIALESLVHAGMAGMLQASEHGRARSGALLQSYLKYRVQSEIMTYLRSLDWVGHAVRTWGRKEARMRHHLTEQLTREAKHEEIAAELSVSLEEYQRLMEHQDEPQFLTRAELAITSEEEWARAQTAFFAHPSQDPLLFLRDPATLDMVRKVLGTLSEHEQLVITLAHYEEMTPQEISIILDITEEQVRQIEREVVARIRQRVFVEHETEEHESRSLSI